MELRPYKSTDLDDIAALDALCFDPPFRFSKAAMRNFAEACNALTRLAVVADDAGVEALAAFCIVHLERSGAGRPIGYVVTLDVAAPYRGQGIGQRLIESLQIMAAEAGATCMRLHVSVRNPVAIRLYERLGYCFLHLEKDFYDAGGDALVYERSLL